MTAVLAQLVTRLDSQDMKLNQLQMNYNSKFETIQQHLHIPSNLVGAQPSAVTTNQAAIDSNMFTHTQTKTNTNPTLQQFCNDHLLGQLADRQLHSLEDDDLGMLQTNQIVGNTRAQKRGLARLGGENAAVLQIPWPHDYILGNSDKRQLYYNDLNWAQFVQGYATIIEREPQEAVARAMVSHLKNWAMQANCIGFENARQFHGSILTDIEDCLYNWLNRDALTEARKKLVLPTSSAIDNSVRQIKENGGNRANFINKNFNKKSDFKRSGVDELTALPCYNFNYGKCKQTGDHDSGTVLWRHVCVKCLKEGHMDRDCNRKRSN
jgi:hypothetical protein